MSQIRVSGWKDYALLDSGGGRKLERLGQVILSRPAPQAMWPARADADVWAGAQGVYHRSNTGGGQWEFKRSTPETWIVNRQDRIIQVKPTGFGHLGVFPEQSPFWDWIYEQTRNAGFQMNVLNLFAYTGYSTLAAAAGGAKVTHVDGAKSAVTWAAENAERNQLKDRPIRWIADDVTKFVSREARRGIKYDAIIMDPPSFGRGPKGEVWKIEQDLPVLLDVFQSIISHQFRFFLFTCHSQHVSPPGIKNLMNWLFKKNPAMMQNMDAGDILIESAIAETSLPAGVFGRACS